MTGDAADLARSEPGLPGPMHWVGRPMFMSSGRPQNPWSASTSPIWASMVRRRRRSRRRSRRSEVNETKPAPQEEDDNKAHTFKDDKCELQPLYQLWLPQHLMVNPCTSCGDPCTNCGNHGTSCGDPCTFCGDPCTSCGDPCTSCGVLYTSWVTPASPVATLAPPVATHAPPVADLYVFD